MSALILQWMLSTRRNKSVKPKTHGKLQPKSQAAGDNDRGEITTAMVTIVVDRKWFWNNCIMNFIVIWFCLHGKTCFADLNTEQQLSSLTLAHWRSSHWSYKLQSVEKQKNFGHKLFFYHSGTDVAATFSFILSLSFILFVKPRSSADMFSHVSKIFVLFYNFFPLISARLHRTAIGPRQYTICAISASSPAQPYWFLHSL